MADEPDLTEALKAVETRLSDYEKQQKDITDRLEKSEKSFQERLAIKEDRATLISEVSRSIQVQNDILQKQLASRWGLITGMLTLVGLAFVLNFGYEIYRIKDVMDAKTYLEDGSKILSDNALQYSGILTDLAYADTLLTQGHRELQRSAYTEAIKLGSGAISRLNNAIKTTGFPDLVSLSNVSYDESTCMLTSKDRLI